MKPISVHVTEADYDEMKSLASRRGRPVAELVREAMAEYLVRERRAGGSVLDLQPHPSGKQISGWTREQIWDEMIEG